jgi:hypothetical protein
MHWEKIWWSRMQKKSGPRTSVDTFAAASNAAFTHSDRKKLAQAISFFRIALKFLHALERMTGIISFCFRKTHDGTPHAIGVGMMDFSGHIENVLHEVGKDYGFRVIRLHRDRSPASLVPLRRNPAKILTMPSRRDDPSAIPSISRVGYDGNALEYWPRGYPAHDDL